MCIIGTQPVHGNSYKRILVIVCLKCYGILHRIMHDLHLVANQSTTGAHGSGNLKFEIIAVYMIIVSVYIVYFLGKCRITLGYHMLLKSGNHGLVNYIPSCRIVFNVCADGFQHTSLFKERKKIDLCTVACQLHPVNLLLTICVELGTITIGCADTLDNHWYNVGAFARQCTPKVQLPERNQFHKVVVIT